MKLFGKKRPVLSERSESKGFTLIELMLVVGIIMILASLVMVSVGKSRARGRDGKRIADLSTIQLALEMYKDSYGVYPSATGPWASSDQVNTYDAQGNLVSQCYWDNLQGTITNYLYPMPKDPINKNGYIYQIYVGPNPPTTVPISEANRTGYYIRARMEDQDNGTEISGAKSWCYYLTGGTGAGNYYGSTEAFCN